MPSTSQSARMVVDTGVNGIGSTVGHSWRDNIAEELKAALVSGLTTSLVARDHAALL